MDSNGQLFRDGEITIKSQLFWAYEKLVADKFHSDFTVFTEEELDWMQGIHDKHLDFYKEERRMHFGAFALVGLALVILLPATLTLEDYFLPLVSIEALLLILLVPYTFVYRKYEEGVRRMMRESVLLEIARRARAEIDP